jgi:hypothetical protein
MPIYRIDSKQYLLQVLFVVSHIKFQMTLHKNKVKMSNPLILALFYISQGATSTGKTHYFIRVAGTLQCIPIRSPMQNWQIL